MLRICVDMPAFIQDMCRYTWDQFALYHQLSYQFVDSKDSCDVLISVTPQAQIRVSQIWVELFRKNEFAHESVFIDEPVIKYADGTEDLFSTCFYMLNGLQEYQADQKDMDHLGRFKFEASYQYKFNCIRENLVAQYFDRLAESIHNISIPKREVVSTIHLSHDVDFLTSGFKMDFTYCMKTGKWGTALSLLRDKIRGVSHWNNIESILEMHKSAGKPSDFFFLTEKGKSKKSDLSVDVSNADYDITEPEYASMLELIERYDARFGLHKSISDRTFEEEMQKLPGVTSINRNHFLHFKLPDHFDALDEAGITDDYSLGFSKAMGFRNSFGLPFQPYNFHTGKAYNVRIHPLNIMDTTFWAIQKQTATQSQREIGTFLNANKNNCQIGVLWHNNVFASHALADFAELYKSLFLKTED